MRRIEIGGQGPDYERRQRNDKGLITFFKTRYDEKLIFFLANTKSINIAPTVRTHQFCQSRNQQIMVQ